MHRGARAGHVVELLARHRREPQQRADLVARRGRRLRAKLEQHRELGPALRAAQQAREVERGLAVARIDLERLAQVGLGLGRVGREPHVGLGGRRVEPGLERAIGRRVRLLHVLRGELVPVGLGERELGDCLLRHRVVTAHAQDIVERGARARRVEQVAVEDHALLEQEVDLAIDVAGRRELDIERSTIASGRPRVASDLRALANADARVSGGV